MLSRNYLAQHTLCLLWSFAAFSVANVCLAQDQCKPLAHVAFSANGIAKLSSAIVTQQFELLKDKVNRISGFKQIQIRPKCTEPDTALSKCVPFKGLPELDGYGNPTFKGYRPISLDLDLKKTMLDMQLARPITCNGFTCKASIEIISLIVDGTITHFMYADNGQLIADKLKPEFSLVKPAIYNLEIDLNPDVDSLDQLATTNIRQHSVEMQSGSIKINLRPLLKTSNSLTQTHGLADMLRQVLNQYRIEMSKPHWGESQVARFKVDFIVNKMAEIDKSLYPNGIAPACSELSSETLRQSCINKQLEEMKMTQDRATAAYQKYLIDQHTSESQMAASARETKIPTDMSDEQVINFFKNPPATLNIDEFHQMLFKTSNKFKAQDSGFADLQTGSLVILADQFLQNFMPTIFDDKWHYLIEKDLKPAVTQQVNNDLNHADYYWGQVSKVPSLNLQSLERKSRLTNELNNAEAQLAGLDANSTKATKLVTQVAELKKQLDQLDLYMSTDWLPLITTVIIDHTAPNPQLIKMQLFESNARCSVLTSSEFAEESDSDLMTDFNLRTIQMYFQKMVENNKLSLCVGSDDTGCKGGSKVVINSTPKISCENGGFKFNFDYKAKGLGASTQFVGAVGNCDGAPCFQLSSTQSKLKNVFINFFVGGILNRSVSGALQQANGYGKTIPDVTLTGVEINNLSCATRLKWAVNAVETLIP